MAKCTAAGLVVFRKLPYKIEYLLLQTSYGKHHWTPPKGYVDETDKSEMDTALRETKEESGLTQDHVIIYEDSKYTMEYKIPPDFKLKTVYYWLAQLKDNGTEVKLSKEHQDYKWAILGEALELGEYKEMKELLFKYDEYIRTKLM